MRLEFKQFMPLLAVFILLGCKIETDAKLYTSDVFANNNVVSSAVLTADVLSCESAEERYDDILAIFSAPSEAKIQGCKNVGFQSKVQIELKFEVASEESDFDIGFFRDMSNESYIEIDGSPYLARGIKPFLNKEFIRRIDTFMKSQFQEMSADNFELVVSIHNDAKGSLITANNAWINGDPRDKFYRERLPDRNIMQIGLSDVSNALVYKQKQPTVIWIYEPYEPAVQNLR
jgi:hypothetical protein